MHIEPQSPTPAHPSHPCHVRLTDMIKQFSVGSQMLFVPLHLLFQFAQLMRLAPNNFLHRFCGCQLLHQHAFYPWAAVCQRFWRLEIEIWRRRLPWDAPVHHPVQVTWPQPTRKVRHSCRQRWHRSGRRQLWPRGRRVWQRSASHLTGQNGSFQCFLHPRRLSDFRRVLPDQMVRRMPFCIVQCQCTRSSDFVVNELAP